MESWKRNLYVIWAAEFVAIAGFTVVLPFLPYYVSDLGVTELHQVTLWSGALFAAHAVTMAIFAPIWGSLADRYGRKLMVQRAMFGGAVILVAMGLVQNVQQLVILRAIQGALTGTIPAATALVASSTPRHKAGYALGLLQMAVWTGASVGPLIGGVIADTLGYRTAFWVTGGMLFLAGLMVRLLVEEEFRPAGRDKDDPEASFWYGVRLAVRTPVLLSLFSVRILVRTAVMTMGPILPLFVQSLVPATVAVASLAGLVSAASAVTIAIGSLTLGRLGDRIGHRRLLLSCAVAVAALYVPQYFVTSPWQLILLQGVLGLVMSGVLISINALLANLSPAGHEGAVYGVDASVIAAANALGPMLGASVGASLGLRAPFLVAAAVFIPAVVVVWLLIPSDSEPVEPAVSY